MSTAKTSLVPFGPIVPSLAEDWVNSGLDRVEPPYLDAAGLTVEAGSSERIETLSSETLGSESRAGDGVPNV